MAASSSLLRSAAGRALRRSITRRSYPTLPAERRQSGYKKALPFFARFLAENPRRLFSSDRGGRTEPNEKLFSMDLVLERKRQFEKNKDEEGAFRDADILEHDSKDEQLLRKRLASTVDKLSGCLKEHTSNSRY